jgi:hypothetical protein
VGVSRKEEGRVKSPIDRRQTGGWRLKERKEKSIIAGISE